MKTFRAIKRLAALSALIGAAALLAAPAPPTHTADEEGISPQIESAIDRGLQTLANSQKADGSWSDGPVAITALASMAFMARGHVPGQGPYGDLLNRSIDNILNAQSPEGVLSDGGHVMYEHGICTIALCEAYGMLDERRQERARAAISRAVRVILDAQRITKNAEDQGGWRYTPKATDSDTSVTGWQLMALRGARNIGAFLPADVIDGGIAYIKRRATPSGGFAYTGTGGVNAAMTGTGVLSLILLGQPDATAVKAGGNYLLLNRVSDSGHYYYATYYCAQAAWQLGGEYWKNLNRQITASLLAKQRPDGAWGNGSNAGAEASNPFCTSMAVLALTVPYRYLPIYQR